MRYRNLQNSALISVLVAGVAVIAACSSGSDNPSGAGTTAGGTAGTTGTSGTTSTGTTSSGVTSSGATTGGSTAATGAGGSSGVTTGGTTTGTGGAGGSGPAGPSVCDGKGTRLLALGDSKVDDFEGAVISPGWSSFNDVMPTANAFHITQEVGGAVGTGHSGHYAGTGAHTTALGGFGVGLVYNTAIDKVAGIFCVDITPFDGVTFWAKAATAGAKVAVNFIIPETSFVDDGGDCMVKTTCYNHPSKSITLTTSWMQYSVAFSEGAGGTVGATPVKVKTVLQELGWLTPDAAWDFSLDEIQFYKGTPPTGPAAHGDAGP